MSRLILDSHRVFFLNKLLDLCVSQIFWLMQGNYRESLSQFFFPWNIHCSSCYQKQLLRLLKIYSYCWSDLKPFSSYKFSPGCMLAEEFSSLITYRNCHSNTSVVRIVPKACEKLFINCFHRVLQRWGNITAILRGKLKHGAMLRTEGHPVGEGQSCKHRLGFIRPHIGF